MWGELSGETDGEGEGDRWKQGLRPGDIEEIPQFRYRGMEEPPYQSGEKPTQ